MPEIVLWRSFSLVVAVPDWWIRYPKGKNRTDFLQTGPDLNRTLKTGERFPDILATSGGQIVARLRVKRCLSADHYVLHVFGNLERK
jgi:hypothetical protein